MQELYRIRLRGTTDDNFWEVNPEFNVVKEIKSFREKIGDDEKSSKIMWSLWLLFNFDSPLKDMRFEEKVVDVCENYLEEDIYNYEAFMNWYMDAFRSYEEKVLAKWEKDLIEREQLFDSLSWTKENLKEKEAMLSKRAVFFEEYMKAKSKVNTQIEDRGNWGDYSESLAESGGLIQSIDD